MNIKYEYLFLAQWRNGQPRPVFDQPVFYFEYDGTHCAYQAEGDMSEFLFWVVGVIHDTTNEQLVGNETDNEFLDRVGVSYGIME